MNMSKLYKKVNMGGQIRNLKRKYAKLKETKNLEKKRQSSGQIPVRNWTKMI